jgi:peptide/nickel transport system permease protein
MLTSYGFKPHQNLLVQYLEYLRNMLTGHWGVSIGATLGEPVSTIVGQALPWTLGLVGHHRPGLPARLADRRSGGVATWWPTDSVLPPVFVVTSALPYFWVGLMLILVFSVWTHGWLPSDFNYDPDLQPEFSLGFIENVLTTRCSGSDDSDHLDRCLDPDDAQQHDHHAGRRLRADGAGKGLSNTDHDRLRGT